MGVVNHAIDPHIGPTDSHQKTFNSGTLLKPEEQDDCANADFA